MGSHLLVSLSGITAATLDDCAMFADRLAAGNVPLSLLVAPRGQGHTANSATIQWVRDRAAHDADVLLHGYDLSSNPTHLKGLRRGGEFASLPAHEARLRLHAALAIFEGLGLHSTVFAPPRWIASRGTAEALRRRDFRLCADLGGVRDLSTGTVLPGRVHGFGRGTRTEPWWCSALVLGAARTARLGGLVRIAVDATDLTRSGPRQAVTDAIDIALHHGAHPATYAALTRPEPPHTAVRQAAVRHAVVNQPVMDQPIPSQPGRPVAAPARPELAEVGR
jgi:predicted deacetylase